MTDNPLNKYVLYEKSTGKALSSGTSFHVERMETGEIGVIIGESVDDVQKVYVRNGQIMHMTDRPSSFHEWDYVRSAWVFNSESAWHDVRMKRNLLLQQTDWTQLTDVPATTMQEYWGYRQALRDITNQPDPMNIIWPSKPSN